MEREHDSDNRESQRRVEAAYTTEKPRFLARLRAAGKSLEEAEDLVHDVYAETLERLHLVPGIHNLSVIISLGDIPFLLWLLIRGTRMKTA